MVFQPPSNDELSRIESQLVERVSLARADYERADAEACRLCAIKTDLGLSHPDGRGALRQATRIQRQATMRYREALNRLNFFVLQFKLPRDWPS